MLVGVLLGLGGAPSRGEPAGGGTTAASAAVERARVLATGSRIREESLQRVAATAVVQRFLSETFLEVYGSPAIAKQRHAGGQRCDRDMAAVRFSTDETRLRFELQCMPWSGSLYHFIAADPRLALREAGDVGDLSFQEFCDGERVYQIRRYGTRPSFSRTGTNVRSARATRGHIREWLGMTLFGRPVSDVLSDPAVRIAGVDRARLGDEACEVVSLGMVSNGTTQAAKCWVVPSKGFAIARAEVTGINDAKPDTGTRNVWVWGDFHQAAETWVPQTVEWRHYDYGARREQLLHGWTFTQRVILSNIQVGKHVSFDLLDHPVPIAAVADPLRVSDVSGPDADPLAEMSDTLWKRCTAFAREPAPTPDPAFEKPMTREDLEALRREFGLNAP